MADFKIYKVNALPASPVANAVYFVANGGGVDMYVTDSSGNAKAVNSVSNVGSGVYNPTLSNMGNVSSYFIEGAIYYKVNNMVTVTGYLSIDPTSTGSTYFNISLPSGLQPVNLDNVSGLYISADTASVESGLIQGIDNNMPVMQFSSKDANAINFTISFTYKL